MSKKVTILLTAVALLAIVLVATASAATNENSGDIQPASNLVESLDTYHLDKADMAKRGPDADLVSVIVDLDLAPVSRYTGGINGLAATSPEVTGVARIDVASPDVQAYVAYVDAQLDAFTTAAEGAVSGATVVHRYNMVIGGVSMVVPAGNVNDIAALPGVKVVYPDRLEQLDTDVSPAFIGAPVLWDALGGQEVAGEGVIVGVIDSGIWPEHSSYSDPDPAGNAYPLPPVVPGTCDFGNTAFNPDDAPFTCNNKLIGAYDFTDTYKAVVGLIPTEFDSARDSNGHGTHTSSTAAGNADVPATLLGVDRGIVSGIAPRAHVVMYKGCGLGGCYNSDTSASMQQAILDGVDVMNYSISGGGDPYNDAVSLAFLDAYAAGVLVSPSAGNSGPGTDTTAHREPWTITVGASTSDRHFISDITLSGPGEPPTGLYGASVTDGVTDFNLVDAEGIADSTGDDSGLCLNAYDPGTFAATDVVLCKRGQIARVLRGAYVEAGGGGGVILYNPVQQGLSTDNYAIPGVHVENDIGQLIKDYIVAHPGEVMVSFTAGTATYGPDDPRVTPDMMAAFSSRGGPGQTLGISKPDITAPGVQILAGMTPLPENEEGGLPGQLFQSIQGTSMSAPQIAGSAALVKALHPDWTPGQIKSAIMTTATQGVVKEDGATQADAFDFGSGRVDLTVAGDPGLTISDSAVNFVMYENNLWNSNYPSLYVPNMPAYLSVERMLMSELDTFSRWDTTVVAPPDLGIGVPDMIVMDAGDYATIQIEIDASAVPVGEYRMAWLYLDSTTGHSVAFPITVVRGEQMVALDKTCEPAELILGEMTSCTVSVSNNGLTPTHVYIEDRLPAQLELMPETLEGAEADGNGFVFEGGLSGGSVPIVNVAVDPTASPFGYVPLADFSATPFSMTDESIDNWNVPSFEYAGETYGQVGVVSNGYIVVGGGTGADVDYINTALPDAALPNNVLAPFWTDLNPADGGRGLIALLTDGVNSWIVVEWEQVPNWGDGELNTFQVWIGYGAGEDISFTYGSDITDGDGGALTVGAENKYGSSGGMVFFDGAGDPPAPSYPNGDYEVDVFSVPGAPGETREIAYMAEGVVLGPWTNTAMMWGSFPGVESASASGEVMEPIIPDEITVAMTVVADTWVNGGDTASNFDAYATSVVRTTGLDNVLLTFDRSSLPEGVEILRAELMINTTFESGSFGKELTVLNTEAFDSTMVTYDDAPAVYNPGAAVPVTIGTMTFDVAGNIAAWDAMGAQATADGHLAYLAISGTGPWGRVVFDSLETYEAVPAMLEVTYKPAE